MRLYRNKKEVYGKYQYSNEELLENDWKIPLCCPGMVSLKVMDLLLLGSLWSNRAKVLSTSLSKLNLVYSHLLQTTSLPLCFTTLKGILELKIYKTVSFEIGLQLNEMQYGVQSIMNSSFQYFSTIHKNEKNKR